MATAYFPTYNRSVLDPCPTLITSAPTLDAAGESVFAIGRIRLEGGSGTKTISAAGGGKIWWTPFTTLTWANASTNLSVGIQDVDAATGLEDTTFDVKADLVPGTDTLTVSVMTGTAMDTGTKDIAHNQLVAIGFEMTARGGTDLVRPAAALRSDGSIVSFFPYGTQDTGSGPAKLTTGVVPLATIQFDDGTYGWIEDCGAILSQGATGSYHLDSTPDERGLLFELPWATGISGFDILIANVVSGDLFEVCLYSDPLGTPSLVEAVTYDPDILAGSGNGRIRVELAAVATIATGTKYGVTVRPTTTNSLGLWMRSYGSGNAALRRAFPLGEDVSHIYRTGNSGVFTEVEYEVPMIAIRESWRHDGAASGGGSANLLRPGLVIS